MVGLYLVAQEPSPREGTAEVCSRLKEYTPADGGPLDFLMFGRCVEKRGQIPNKVVRGHGDLRLTQEASERMILRKERRKSEIPAEIFR
jgi:hypothetical protein